MMVIVAIKLVNILSEIRAPRAILGLKAESVEEETGILDVYTFDWVK